MSLKEVSWSGSTNQRTGISKNQPITGLEIVDSINPYLELGNLSLFYAGVTISRVHCIKCCIMAHDNNNVSKLAATSWAIIGPHRVITLIFHVIVDFINSFILWSGGVYT